MVFTVEDVIVVNVIASKIIDKLLPLSGEHLSLLLFLEIIIPVHADYLREWV